MSSITHLIPEVRAFRPFLPAKDYETSLRFYEAIGFHVYPLGGTLAELSLGQHAFLLQGYYVKEWAENMMMHVLVEDVSRWWQHIEPVACSTPKSACGRLSRPEADGQSMPPLSAGQFHSNAQSTASTSVTNGPLSVRL